MTETTIRAAVPDDVHEIVELVHDLAVYEKEPDAVKLTPEVLREQLFGERPAIFAHVAPAPEGSGRRIEGFALWYLSYSTWEGTHGIYLEDLFVLPEQRGRGHGKRLLSHLAKLAVERGCGRFEWSVLDWNAPSIAFYRSIGALPREGWTLQRLSGAALAALAGQER